MFKNTHESGQNVQYYKQKFKKSVYMQIWANYTLAPYILTCFEKAGLECMHGPWRIRTTKIWTIVFIFERRWAPWCVFVCHTLIETDLRTLDYVQVEGDSSNMQKPASVSC